MKKLYTEKEVKDAIRNFLPQETHIKDEDIQNYFRHMTCTNYPESIKEINTQGYWRFSTYINEVIIAGVRKLQKENHGWPAYYFEKYEDWEKTLQKIWSGIFLFTWCNYNLPDKYFYNKNKYANYVNRKYIEAKTLFFCYKECMWD